MKLIPTKVYEIVDNKEDATFSVIKPSRNIFVCKVKETNDKYLLSKDELDEYRKQIAKHIYDCAVDDGRNKVRRGWAYHYDRFVNPNKDQEEQDFINSLNQNQ